MKRIRRFEEVTAEIYPSDKIKSPIHLAIGQEQVAVAVCDGLEDGDWVGGYYRSHAVYLAKGGSMPEIMAEMYGKASGCCGGKGGSMHVISTAAGVIGSSAVVASQIPVAAGYALAAKQAGRGRVVAVFLGDGAAEEGCFYETLNFAALHRLPLFFVVENNGLAIHEPLAKRRADPDGICPVAEALGVPATRIIDGDIFAIHKTAGEAIAALRAGSGPRLMEVLVHRRRQHVGPREDYDQGYRSRAEAEPWIASDPLARLTEQVDAGLRQRIDAEIEDEIASAVLFSENSPPPPPEKLTADVYA
jgi:TPP-dependent pyruvate/acetoin dehydrogenase alpha subunit